MLLEENWAISAERIREYFRCQDDMTEADSVFLYKSCRITLTPLPPSQTGIFAVSRTWIRMEGVEKDLREIHRRFFLRFLSAGG